MNSNENLTTFFYLLQCGLWKDSGMSVKVDSIPLYDRNVNWGATLQLAREQSVVGLFAAGIERCGVTMPKPERLLVVGQTMLIEQQNRAMNEFVSQLMIRLKKEGVRAILVKGQGVAQCYERPLWRSCGDIDLLLDAENYQRAKEILTPLAKSLDEEDELRLHLGMAIGEWIVELHGTMRIGIGKRIDAEIDEMQKEICDRNKVRVWKDGDADVNLPSPDNDIILVFTHILQHFFQGGIGLRQICDWSRLLWTYRTVVDVHLLESRIRRMRLMSEWRSFAALAVDFLGMPVEAMPFYEGSKKWKRKAEKIKTFVLETGNFGHNRDASYYHRYPYVARKIISLWRYTGDSMKHLMIFPRDASRVWWLRIRNSSNAVAKGK